MSERNDQPDIVEIVDSFDESIPTRECEPAGIGANEQRHAQQLNLQFAFNFHEDLKVFNGLESEKRTTVEWTSIRKQRFILGSYARARVLWWLAQGDDAPPEVAKFLLLLIPKKNREGLLGDLEEEYRTILLPEYGVRLARFHYWWHTVIALACSVVGAVERLSRAFKRN